MMLTEDEVFQAIYQYAIDKYEKILESLWERHDRQNPFSLLPPGDPKYRDYICQIIYELPFTDNGYTIAEEFANLSDDIDQKMKEKIMKMRYPTRSIFQVKSIEDRYVMIEDIQSGGDYRVLGVDGGSMISEGSIIIGRIHPFGNHYRFIGEYTVSDSIKESGLDDLMESILGNFLRELEGIPFRPNSTFTSIMKKYPANWVDRISRTYRIKKRLKNEKIEAILEKITRDTDSIVSKLSREEKEILGICMEKGGYVEIMLLGNYKDDSTYFQEKRSGTPMGRLRQKGLIFIGRMKRKKMSHRVAFIPLEIRNSLEPYFHVKQKGPNRTLDDIFTWE